MKGAPGSGKSALLAAASIEYRGSAVVIRRFIGASVETLNGPDLLKGLCLQLGEMEIPADFAGIEGTFISLLEGLGEKKRLVLFVDGIEQLPPEDPARALMWLPAELPPFVKVVVSTTADIPGKIIELPPMNATESEALLDAWLGEGRRTLEPWQRAKVLQGYARCPIPLYLRLAAEESMFWKSYSTPDSCRLGEGISGVLDAIFNRLAGDGNHGKSMVENSLGYLAASRYGLSEDELIGLLSCNESVWSDFQRNARYEIGERRLPFVVWSRLRYDLEPYLSARATEGGLLLTLSYGQIEERWRAASRTRHRELAQYFGGLQTWLDSERKMPNIRKAVELPFQQRASEDWQAARATLLDGDFLALKCAAGLAPDLETDYVSLPAAFHDEAVDVIQAALALSMHVLLSDRFQYASQLTGRLLSRRDIPAIGTFVDDLAKAAPQLWIRPLHEGLHAPGTRLVRSLKGHAGSVESVALAADGRLAVSASDDGTAKVWDLKLGRTILTYRGHTDAILTVAITSDARIAVSGSRDGEIHVWDVADGRTLYKLAKHTARVNCVAISSDDRRAFSASEDRTLSVWDLRTGRMVRTLSGHNDEVVSLAAIPEGDRIVALARDGDIRVWDLDTGQHLRSFGGAKGANNVLISHDGKTVIATSEEIVRVWSLETGEALSTAQLADKSAAGFCLPRVISSARYGRGAAFIGDGNRLAVAASDLSSKILDLKSGRTLLRLGGHSGPIRGIAVTPNGILMISASGDHSIKVWNIAELLERGESRGEPGAQDIYREDVTAIAVTPDGDRAIAASQNGSVRMWDVERGRLVKLMRGHTMPVHSLAIPEEVPWVISASDDGTVRVQDMDSGEIVQELHGCEGHGLAVTPDAERVLFTTRDTVLTLRDLRTGEILRTLAKDKQMQAPVVLTQDAEWLVTAFEDNTLRLLPVEGGRAPITIKNPGVVLDVKLTSDERFAVTLDLDGGLEVWDLEGGVVTQSLVGHTAMVFSLALMSERPRAVATSEDGTLKVWNLGIGEPLASFYFDSVPTCCAVSNDDTIIVGDSAGQLHFLRFESGHIPEEILRSNGKSDAANRIPLLGGRFAIAPTIEDKLRREPSALIVKEHKGRRELTIHELPNELAVEELKEICLFWVDSELVDLGMIVVVSIRMADYGLLMATFLCTTRDVSRSGFGNIGWCQLFCVKAFSFFSFVKGLGGSKKPPLCHSGAGSVARVASPRCPVLRSRCLQCKTVILAQKR